MSEYRAPYPIVLVLDLNMMDLASREHIREGLAESVQRYAQTCVDNAIAYERRVAGEHEDIESLFGTFVRKANAVLKDNAEGLARWEARMDEYERKINTEGDDAERSGAAATEDRLTGGS